MDLRYALRVFRRAPGFAAASVLCLALGIGSAAAIFCVADALVLRPLPYPNSSRLVVVFNRLSKLGIQRLPVNDQTFREYSAQNSVFESTSGFLLWDGTMYAGAEPEHVNVLDVMPTLFSMLGVRPAVGRPFDDHDVDVAILTYPLYARRFGADPKAIGATVRLDDRILKIVGVLPRGFEFTNGAEVPDLWTPMRPRANGRWGAVNMIARLRAGVSIASARSSMDALVRHLEQTLHLYRGPNGEDRGYGVRLVSLHEELFGEFRSATFVLMGAVGAVLLIVLANVANLILARAVSREKEFAVRRAVGASQWRLARQRMTETAVLIGGGAAMGTLAATWAVKVLVALSPERLPPVAVIGLGGRELAAVCAISVVLCIVFGLAPSVANPKRRSAPALVAAEAALATLLLISAGLLLKSFTSLSQIDPGFRAGNLLIMDVELPQFRYPLDRDRAEFANQVRTRLASLPGVLSATSGTRLPINGPEILARGGPFQIEGRPGGGAAQTARSQAIDVGYLRTLEIPLMAGRDFGGSDRAAAPLVAIVNQTLARQFFPEGGAIGHRIVTGSARSDASWMTIVGVAADVKAATLDEETLPQIYVPLAQHPSFFLAIAIRTGGDPLRLARAATGVVRGIDSQVAPMAVMPMQERVSGSLSQPRFRTVVVGFFAAAALFLAGMGTFAVVAHATSRRTREIGIRMALGADAAEVVRHVVLGGMRPVIAGIALGLGGALLTGRAMASLLFRVQPSDPWIFGLGAGLLTGIAVAACAVPAFRAARVQPAEALRAE
jgi:putative ABC transport system permease protein